MKQIRVKYSASKYIKIKTKFFKMDNHMASAVKEIIKAIPKNLSHQAYTAELIQV